MIFDNNLKAKPKKQRHKFVGDDEVRHCNDQRAVFRVLQSLMWVNSPRERKGRLYC